ncbi:MAG: bifunctional UDP-N-acetylglucosamine diphosphorylase/glucosamine-1-phosphate N-acetyltransferase GlmU [Nitrospiraceae bacterium]
MSKSQGITGLGVIVMAAGLGKRMQSKLGKVLHPVAGQPMVLYAVSLAERLATQGTAVVVGHQPDRVRVVLDKRPGMQRGQSSLKIILQTEQLGTGHAVLQARPAFPFTGRGVPSTYLILNGDTPLLTDASVRELLRVHQSDKATVTILTAKLNDATGYGRVVRRAGGAAHEVLRVVEERDASVAEREIREVNVGTYVVDGRFLFEALDKLHPQNAQKEYYLTDIIGIAVGQGLRVSAFPLRDPEEGLGVNSRRQLATAERIVRRQIRDHWLDAGVTMRDPSSTWIDAGVTIGQDTVLYPNVTLEGTTAVGEDCVIRSNNRLTDCAIGNRVELLDNCVLRESRLEDDTSAGPFVHLRPGTIVRRKAKVGNFVEMKKADLGEGSKANHLSYLGDARIGKDVNIGAGTITCNYDGAHKYQTVIEDGVFVGSDTQMVAPVTIGRGSVIAAGTTVTQDVLRDALAISRVPQMNRPGWAARRRALLASDHPSTASAPVGKTKSSRRLSKSGTAKTAPRKKRGRA